MEICSVTLKNFKIHADSYYEFRPGTNAICGENGAGKTSILEAIAWVLFDHSDYTRGELIRTGAKSAQVAVNFISSLDGRVYEARRCTSRGYELHDPQINVNLGAHKLEDVQTWLREHLGTPPQTDLARLFAETIGIPQGTFTADFLKRPNDRKKIFDPILKVAEYKQTYEQMRDLETYAKTQVLTLVQQLTHHEQQLADWDTLQQQASILKTEIVQDEAQVEQLAHEVTQHQSRVDQLMVQAQQVQALETQLGQLETQLAGKTEYLKRLEADWISAQQSVTLCREKRVSFQTYQAAQDALKELAEQRRQQQAVFQQRDALRHQLRDREVAASQLQGQLATFTELHRDCERWQALVQQQEQLEHQIQTLQQVFQGLEPIRLSKQNLMQQLAQRQEQRSRLQSEIASLEQRVIQVEPLLQMEQEQQHLQTHLSHIQAGQTFAVEIQGIVAQTQAHRDLHLKQVPMAQRMLALAAQPDFAFVQQVLESGMALNAQLLQALQTLLHELTDPAAASCLEAKLQTLTEQIHRLRIMQQQLAALPLKQQLLAESHREAEQIQQQCVECDRQLTQATPLQAQLTQLNAELKQLNDPKGNLRLLQQQLQQEPKIQAQLAQLQTGLTQIQQEMGQREQEVAAFAALDQQFETQQQLLSTHHSDYQQYLRHREQANKFRDLDPQRTAAQTEIAALQATVQQVQQQVQQAQPHHDPQQLLTLNIALSQLKQQKDHCQGGIQPKRAQLQMLEEQLQARQALAQQQERDRQVLVQRQKILQFVNDARNIFNQSGPRITKYYLTEVSQTAETLFRELLNRDEVTLRWTEDYEIQVQERGYWRSFRSLSGGEQMCAALAVRLALLRVLAEVDIAFFDEPTTNMDQLRRQQLAEAISNLKAFRQLIVISHDDTFENVTEHIIRIER